VLLNKETNKTFSNSPLVLYYREVNTLKFSMFVMTNTVLG